MGSSRGEDYLDTCGVNRLTDDESQQRVREEAEAIELILCSVRSGESIWIISVALIYKSKVVRSKNESGTALLRWHCRRCPSESMTASLMGLDILNPQVATVSMLCTWQAVRPEGRRCC